MIPKELLTSRWWCGKLQLYRGGEGGRGKGVRGRGEGIKKKIKTNKIGYVPNNGLPNADGQNHQILGC